MLKLVGIIRNKEEVRELFEVDGKLVTFDVNQSAFEVICKDASSITFAEESLEREDCFRICLYVDENADYVDDTVAVIIPARSDEDSMELKCYHVDAGGACSYSIDPESLELEFLDAVSISPLEEIEKYFNEGDADTIEDGVLIREYQHKYLTV